MRLKNNVAVVTGVANTLAQHIALRFAAEGANVAVTDADGNTAERVKQDVHNGENKALALEVDITDEGSTAKMAQKVIDKFGRIDILVNSAVMFPEAFETLDKWTAEEWDRVLSFNIKGAFLCVKAVAEHMKRQNKGKIINFTTSTIFSGQPYILPYLTSRGALYLMTRGLARELGEYNIAVNTVSVSYIGDMEGAAINNLPPDMAESFINQQFIKRNEIPEDVVGTAVFLASSDSDFFTGQLIACDGGLVVH